MIGSVKWAGLFLVVLCGLARGAEPSKSYAADAASKRLAAATKEATAESKLLFVKSGWPGCGYCRMFDQYHQSPEVQAILKKYYVVISIDVENMPDGKAVFSQFAKPGGPSWVILKPNHDVVVTSFKNGDKGNTGFPARADELAFYKAALKKASPAITQNELDTLGKQLLAVYGR